MDAIMGQFSPPDLEFTLSQSGTVTPVDQPPQLERDHVSVSLEDLQVVLDTVWEVMRCPFTAHTRHLPFLSAIGQ